MPLITISMNYISNILENSGKIENKLFCIHITRNHLYRYYNYITRKWTDIQPLEEYNRKLYVHKAS